MFSLKEEIQKTKVRLCLDCGKCTVVCPVAQSTDEFNPRRIIQRSLGISGSDVDDVTIWQCLNCDMCVEYCNYSVKLTDFINVLRNDAVNDGYRVECSHSGMLQAIMHMMSNHEINQERLKWLPQDIKQNPDCDTAFFVGCAPYFDVVFDELGVKSTQGVIGALRLLNKAGVDFKLLENERCCGRDLLIQGDREGFLALAEKNRALFQNRGIKRIITYCPECFDCLKHEYPKALGPSGIEVVNLMQVVDPLFKNNNSNKNGNKITYHDPCTLGRGFRIFDQPRKLLKSIDGVDLMEMDNNRESSLCCGANPWAYCNAVNKQIQGKRLAQAQATGADILVTACPKCEIHLKCAQKGDDTGVSQIKIVDLAYLAAESLAGGK